MQFPKTAKIVEVSPRDGLQNEPQLLATSDKITLITMLSRSGLEVIEATSFVSPKRVPQMADGGDVLVAFKDIDTTLLGVLVPNEKGYDHARKAGARYMAFLTSASESFSLKNSNCSKDKGLQYCIDLMAMARDDSIPYRAYISCAFDCPYEGSIDISQVIQIARVLHTNGCSEIVIADTIGRATPGRVQLLIQSLAQEIPLSSIAIHFHDTYGQALVNIYSALQLGVSIIDSSVAGLGGCPFARGATGNVATEDLIFMLNGMGIETGVDLTRLQEAGNFICKKLGKENGSRVSVASAKDC